MYQRAADVSTVHSFVAKRITPLFLRAIVESPLLSLFIVHRAGQTRCAANVHIHRMQNLVDVRLPFPVLHTHGRLVPVDAARALCPLSDWTVWTVYPYFSIESFAFENLN